MSRPLRDEDIVRVDDQVFLVTGSNTNWVIVKSGSDATLIDTGYPGDHTRVLASLAAVGVEPQDVTAILVTHAHNDHIGGAQRIRSAYGTPVLMHEQEVPPARREFLDQVSVGQVLANAWRRGVVPWAVHAIRSGGTAHVPVAVPSTRPTGPSRRTRTRPHTGAHGRPMRLSSARPRRPHQRGHSGDRPSDLARLRAAAPTWHVPHRPRAGACRPNAAGAGGRRHRPARARPPAPRHAEGCRRTRPRTGHEVPPVTFFRPCSASPDAGPTFCSRCSVTEPSTNRNRRPQSPDLRFCEENDSIGLDIEAAHRMAEVAFRVHQHRLPQPPPDLPKEAAEHIQVDPGPATPSGRRRGRLHRRHENGRSPAHRQPAKPAGSGTRHPPGGPARHPPQAPEALTPPRSTGTSSPSPRQARGPLASPPPRHLGHARPATTPSGPGPRRNSRHHSRSATPSCCPAHRRNAPPFPLTEDIGAPPRLDRRTDRGFTKAHKLSTTRGDAGRAALTRHPGRAEDQARATQGSGKPTSTVRSPPSPAQLVREPPMATYRARSRRRRPSPRHGTGTGTVVRQVRIRVGARGVRPTGHRPAPCDGGPVANGTLSDPVTSADLPCGRYPGLPYLRTCHTGRESERTGTGFRAGSTTRPLAARRTGRTQTDRTPPDDRSHP